jgi:hypothetical protein
MQELKSPTVIVLVDRTDLDTQITGTFNAADVANVFPYRFFLRPERRPYSQRQDTRQKQHERTPKGTAESNVRRNMHHVLISII